ncbi:MAG: BMP family ABC transporter substrate-binding protein, partial [Geminicoccaceae bacterium]|nr:BMP family ABC transporter substrate-binding protein [Geminicoccaceae bacterium]
TAIVDNWGPHYIQRTQAVLDGSWATQNVWHGLKDGEVEIAPYNPSVPADVIEAAEAVRLGIIDGRVHPFAGPIRNQAGEVVVAEGATLSDEDLLKMDWYVEGVQA